MVSYSVLWVANYLVLRTTALNDKLNVFQKNAPNKLWAFVSRTTNVYHYIFKVKIVLALFSNINQSCNIIFCT